MAKKKTDATATAIAAKAQSALNNLVSLREEFDTAETAYQTGRKHLYSILGKVFAEYVSVKDAAPKNRCVDSFRALLDDMDDDRAEYAKEGIKTKASSLERVMLRVVCGKAFTEEREKAYGSVLRKAYAQEVHKSAAGFSAWLYASGGVEVLRMAPKTANGKSKAAIAIEAATIRYKATYTEAKMPKGIADAKKAKDQYADGNFYVALVRRDTDTIVATTDKKSAVSKTLESLGEGLNPKDERKQAKASRAEYKAMSQAIFENAASPLKKVA